MKETGLMFKTPLVRAILSDQKIQTRRIAKTAITMGRDSLLAPHRGRKYADVYLLPERAKEAAALCPVGQTGDRIYVRETYWAWGRWETRYSETKRRDEWHFVDMTLECEQPYLYQADGVSQGRTKRLSSVTPTYWRRPAILMPKTAARIWLEVTGVRLERLQDISVADVKAEGVAVAEPRSFALYGLSTDERAAVRRRAAIQQFRELWESTGGDWAANPWVWVIDFKQLSHTGQPQA